MFYYPIHGVVDVIVDLNVAKSVVNAIDFQLNYFRKNSPLKTPAPYQICVKAYSDITLDLSLQFSQFHLVRGVQGFCLHDPSGHLYIEKEGNSLKIYCEAPNFLINLYIQFFLIELGYTMVHAAAVADRDGNVILFPAAGGVGKTGLIGHLVAQNGYKTMGDDIVLLSKHGSCFAFPRSFVLKECHRTIYPEVFRRLSIGKTSNYKFKKFVAENAPFIGITKKILRRLNLYHHAIDLVNMAQNLAEVPMEEIFGNGMVFESGAIKRIVFLERYEGTQFKVLPLGEKALCRRMFSIIHHEWVDSMRQCFSAAALELVDLPYYFTMTAEIMRAGISGKNSQIFYIPSDAKFKDVIDSFHELIRDI